MSHHTYGILSIVIFGIIFSFIVMNPYEGNTFEGIETDNLGIAIQGYDPVAYFTEGHPVKGTAEYSYIWNEAEWHFASPENRELFAGNPEKYSPNHSGFCAVSMPIGRFAGVNPEKFRIIDGNLYLGWE
jgi:YHS domain-containing protein